MASPPRSTEFPHICLACGAPESEKHRFSCPHVVGSEPRDYHRDPITRPGAETAACGECGMPYGFHVHTCRHAPVRPFPKRILTPEEAAERVRLLAERDNLTPTPTAEHNVIRGAAALAQMMDCIGMAPDDAPDGDPDGYVAKIFCDNEMDLRAVLRYVLSCVAYNEVPLS